MPTQVVQNEEVKAVWNVLTDRKGEANRDIIGKTHMKSIIYSDRH